MLICCTCCKHEHKHKIYTCKWVFQSATVPAEPIVSACGLITTTMSGQGQSQCRTSNRAHVPAQPSPERCLLRVCRGWGCQLLGYIIWAKQRSTTDAFNNPPYAVFCRFGTDGINIFIIVDVLSESYNWSQNKNQLIWFPEARKKYLSAAPLATAAKQQERQ